MDKGAVEPASTSTSNLISNGINAAPKDPLPGPAIAASSTLPDGNAIDLFAPNEPPFRLLDLAAELRNRIYEYSLHHDRIGEQRATPALLQTCKQVKQEATGILYAQSNLTLTVKCTARRLTNDSRVLEIHGDLCTRLQGTTTNIFKALPTAMMKVRQITLVVEGRDCRAITADKSIRRFLYAVCSFLAARNRDLQRFSLSFCVTQMAQVASSRALEDDGPNLLYAIGKLSPTVTIQLPEMPMLHYFASMYLEDSRTKLLPDPVKANILQEHTELFPRMRRLEDYINSVMQEPEHKKRHEYDRLMITLAQIQALSHFVEEGEYGRLVYSIGGDSEMMQRIKWLRILLDVHEKDPRDATVPQQDENGRYFIERCEGGACGEGMAWYRTEVEKCREALRKAHG